MRLDNFFLAHWKRFWTNNNDKFIQSFNKSNKCCAYKRHNMWLFKCLQVDIECGLIPVHSNLETSWVFVSLCVFFLFRFVLDWKARSCFLIGLNWMHFPVAYPIFIVASIYKLLLGGIGSRKLKLRIAGGQSSDGNIAAQWRSFTAERKKQDKTFSCLYIFLRYIGV